MKKSLLLINLLLLSMFSIAQNGSETYDGCEGDGYSVDVNGTTYNEANPSGTEVITGGAFDGSDSTVVIDLTYKPNSTGVESYSGCEGDGYSVDVNGTTYDEANPSGSQTLVAANGCDSIVTIDLEFLPNSTGTETYSGCEGDGYSVDVNGTTYDEANPSGSQTLVAANGCDSIVTIDLEFLPNSTGTESYDGCEGDGYEVIINGNTYDEANPSGTETLVAANGCDSIVTIDLVYKSPGTNLISYTGCTGDGYNVIVNGNTYDENTPTGTETIAGGAANGCDSIITVDLEFSNPTSTVSYNGCAGDGYQVTVNGNVYDENTPSGTETHTGASVNNCDSIVTIDLTFAPAATGAETYTGCEGDGYQVTVNGNTYDEATPSGTETFIGGAVSGCDSIVTIDLTFDAALTGIDEVVSCESYTWIDGVEYTSSNNTATHTLTSVGGCDSIVTLDLTITPSLDLTIDTVINSTNDIVIIAQQTNATYQWLDCDDNFAPISGQNNQTFIPSTNGSYAIKISKGGCVDTSSCINLNTVSTEEFSQIDDNLSIHPNPSEGIFNISGYGKGTSNIIVMDALGRQVTDVTVTKTSTKIDLSDKQSGVYFFSIIQNDERSLRKVILK